MLLMSVTVVLYVLMSRLEVRAGCRYFTYYLVYCTWMLYMSVTVVLYVLMSRLEVRAGCRYST